MNHISRTQIDSYVSQGMLTKRKHPKLDLYILNYTAKTQYERLWDGTVEHLRGVIVDPEGNILEKPFYKIFNLQEIGGYTEFLKPKTCMFEKLDGSLGILYKDETSELGWSLATRGSFESEQAIEGTQMLNTYFLQGFVPDENYTYMFEIIYPENKIVVDYGDQRKLVFLSVYDKKRGVYIPSQQVDIPNCDMFPKPGYIVPFDIGSIQFESNTEGFVFSLSDGRIVKLKSDEYTRLHAMITELSARRIWEIVKEGRSEKELLAFDIPDEYYTWIQEKAKEIRRQYHAHWDAAYHAAQSALKDCSTPSISDVYNASSLRRLRSNLSREMQLYIQRLGISNIATQCALLIAKGSDKVAMANIWEYIKPEHELPNLNIDE